MPDLPLTPEQPDEPPGDVAALSQPSAAAVEVGKPLGVEPWKARAVTVAARVGELARNPAVAATAAVTATVAGRVALALTRRALAAPATTSGPIRISVVIVHHVVHHHVVHVEQAPHALPR